MGGWPEAGGEAKRRVLACRTPRDPDSRRCWSICEAVTPAAVMNLDIANPETEQPRTVVAASRRQDS